MATKKKQILFYAEPKIADWYESLAPGEGTRVINEILLQHLNADADTQVRLRKVEQGVELTTYILASVCDILAVRGITKPPTLTASNRPNNGIDSAQLAKWHNDLLREFTEIAGI
jgi:hypothetical protein